MKMYTERPHNVTLVIFSMECFEQELLYYSGLVSKYFEYFLKFCSLLPTALCRTLWCYHFLGSLAYCTSKI